MAGQHRYDFRILVERYLKGTATEEEMQILEKYYTLFDSAPDISDILSGDELDRFSRRMEKNIKKRTKHTIAKNPLRIYYQIAAGLLIAVSLSWIYRTVYRADRHKAENTARVEKADETVNRFLSLSDGSTVILHKGSKLKIAHDFNENSRNVYLTGEAYFDVSPVKNLPFVIHTGKLKTTVLGTAFNIRAWPNQKDITVSVTRGTVRVDDDQKLIAVLTPEKQVTYHIDSSNSDEMTVDPELPLAWIHKDMTFDEMPLGELTEHIGKRYGVDVVFRNPDLKDCPITGRFIGTETLEEVMKTLALTSNTRFYRMNDTVYIEGEKCL